ncbi:MAG TPA: alpha/beta hydrolase [Chloroflexota bacterium]|nr:alpha/beta hydrolase [Chloroflexota bacterium]
MPDLTLNGHKHHYEEAGTGEPLVMLHAALASSKSLEQHLAGLAQRFRVVLADLRGMGQSAHVPALPADWVADLIALIERLDLAPATVYGASLGGRIAMKTAVLRPDLIKRLILDHPVIAVDPATDAALSANLSPDAVDDRRARYYREQHGEDWQAVVQMYFTSRGKPDFQGYLDMREDSKAITQPALIMRGDRRDPAHPLAHAAALAGNIAGAWLWIRPNSPIAALYAGGEEAYALIGRFAAET